MTAQKLPAGLSGREVRKALDRAGFKFDRQRGRHVVPYREDPHFAVVVPGRKRVRVGTLRKIIRDARLTVDEILTYL